MRPRQPLSHLLIITALLAGVWYLLSGKFDLLHFGSGLVAAFVIARNVLPVEDATRFRPLRFLAHIPWLGYQIFLSNLRVARVVLSPRMPIAPTFLAQHPGVSGPRALTTLGSSITLTPGTLTVDVSEGEIFVHALDAASAQDVREQVMARRVARLFEEETGR